MIPLLDAPPVDNASFRRSIYEGLVVRLAPTSQSKRLVASVIGEIEEVLGRDGPIRQAQFRLSDEEMFERVGRLRKSIYTSPWFHALLREVVDSCGFDSDRTAFDPIRLRTVTSGGFENPLAAPIYVAHRDTWYAHPPTLITWWIPLHDLTPAETFEFFPDDFRQPLPNDSERFDYDTWTAAGSGLKIGWQGRQDGIQATYPGLIGEPGPGRRVGFSCQAGEILLFSGAQFHQTLKNRSGQTRFSLDFRTVQLDDHAQGLGAPNVDNRSTGSALRDYIQPGLKIDFGVVG